MNPYQAFEFGRLRDLELVGSPGELYKPTPEPIPFPQLQPMYQEYSSNSAYVNTNSKTPVREKMLLHRLMTVATGENSIAPVVSAFISTVVNTVPHVSLVNGRVPHMYEMLPATPIMSYVNHPTLISEQQMFVPYNNPIYSEAAYHQQVPYVNHNIMSNVASAATYVNSPKHRANHRINHSLNGSVNRTSQHYDQQQCNTHSTNKSKLVEMLPAVKNIMESFSKVKISTSTKKTGAIPRIINSTVDESTSKKNEYKEKVDIMTYVNDDHLYEKFMAKTDNEIEKKPYVKKMAESAKDKINTPKRNKRNKKSTSKRQQQQREQTPTVNERKAGRKQETKVAAVDNYLPYVVESTVNSVIGDLMDSDNEKIIAGNVCPKIRSLGIVEPKVRVQAENVAGMLLSFKENWPKLEARKNLSHRRTAVYGDSSNNEAVKPVQATEMVLTAKQQKANEQTESKARKARVHRKSKQTLETRSGCGAEALRLVLVHANRQFKVASNEQPVETQPELRLLRGDASAFCHETQFTGTPRYSGEWGQARALQQKVRNSFARSLQDEQRGHASDSFITRLPRKSLEKELEESELRDNLYEKWPCQAGEAYPREKQNRPEQRRHEEASFRSDLLEGFQGFRPTLSEFQCEDQLYGRTWQQHGPVPGTGFGIPRHYRFSDQVRNQLRANLDEGRQQSTSPDLSGKPRRQRREARLGRNFGRHDEEVPRNKAASHATVLQHRYRGQRFVDAHGPIHGHTEQQTRTWQNAC